MNSINIGFLSVNILRSSIAVLVFSGSATVHGQEILDDVGSEIEEVWIVGEVSRYSALKSATPIVETSRSITIEDQESIIEKGFARLDEVLTYSAGVSGQTFGFATRGDWSRVRGLKVPQYQDSLQSLFGNYNNARPDIYTLDQVEILKGPASTLYGKGSPGGLINVVSKRPEVESTHEIVASLGNFNYKSLAVDSTGAIDDDESWLYRGIAKYRDEETQVDFVDDKTLVLAPSLTWRPTDHTNITFLLNYTDTKSDTGAQFLPITGTLIAAPNGEFIDHSFYAGEPSFNKYDAESTSFTVLADHQMNATWSTEVTARVTDGRVNAQQAWVAFGLTEDRYLRNADGSLYENGTVPRSFYRQDSTSKQHAIDARLRGSFDTGIIEHELLSGVQLQNVNINSAGYYAYAVGVDFTTGEIDDRYWINVFNPVYGNVPSDAFFDALYTANPEETYKDRGIYISDQMTIGKTNIVVGLRYDDIESVNSATAGTQKDDALSGSIGVLYAFDNGMSPYINFAESFEPTIGVTGSDDNQALEPQEGEQIEVGVKYQPSNVPALITIAYFDIEQINLNDANADVGTVQQQSGVAHISGIEVEAQYQIDDAFVEVNLSHLETEDANGYSFVSVPDDQASVWLGYRPATNFKAGVGVRYVGASLDGVDNIETPSYSLVDFMIGYKLSDWDLSLNVRNAANKEYIATCLARGDCFLGQERTITASARYTF